MSPPLRNVVVVGGSYVGLWTARELMKIIPSSHRVLLVEPRDSLNHIFSFPRFSVLSGHEQKAFIPFSGVFGPGSERHALIKARASSVFKNHVRLDRPWQGSQDVPFDYLVVATGTQLAPPSNTPFDTKAPSIQFLQGFQTQIKNASSLTLVGGGAVGVQLALDIKEIYPEKQVTLVHSRDHLMHQYHSRFHEIVKDAFENAGIKLITGTRVVVPEGGFAKEASPEGFPIQLNNGDTLQTNLVIPATGQKPNNQLMSTLQSTNPEGLINKSNGFIRVKKSLQIDDASYPHIFAVGDIADSGSHKAARPGTVQAGVVSKNLLSLIEGKVPTEEYQPDPAAIHISLGLKRNMMFRNPNVAKGETEPSITEKFDGHEDLAAERMWGRFGVSMDEYRAAI